jgi:hypothetical protein
LYQTIYRQPLYLYPFSYPYSIPRVAYSVGMNYPRVVYPYQIVHEDYCHPIPRITYPYHYSVPGLVYPCTELQKEYRNRPDDKITEGFLTAVGEEAVNQIKSILDTINASRSVILILENNTNMKLRKISENLQHGGWAITPKGQIPPKSTLVFGAMSAAWSVGTGTEGSITYAGDGVELTIYWDNPFIGSNSCKMQLTGPNASKYYTNNECGSGNHAAQMRYELYSK